MKTTTTFAFLVALLTLAICFTPTAQAADVTFDWATVGNPGNAGELSGAGAGGFGPDAIVGGVANTYRISKTEVTNARYTDFLNAVAVTDTNSLYNTLMNSGTFDQGGNVWEWNEAVVSSSGRGGSWGSRSISFSDSLAWPRRAGSSSAPRSRNATLVFEWQVSLSQVRCC